MQTQEKNLNTKLPKCPRGDDNLAIIHRTLGILPCQKCRDEDSKTQLRQAPRFATQSQTDRVQQEYDKNSKDVVQPWTDTNKPNPEFAQAYPDKVGNYFGEDTLKK